MKRLIVLALLALPVFAADYELGIRHIVATPAGDSGALDIPMSRGFAGTVEAFWTGRISTQFAASFVNPEAIYGDEVDLGTLGLDIYSATVAGVSYMPLTARTSVIRSNVVLPDEIRVNPVLVTAGATWRF